MPNVAELNQRVKLRKQTKRLGATQRKILLLLLGGVALSCTRSLGKQWRIIEDIRDDWRAIKRQAAERALEALYESRLIEARKNPDGAHTLVLSENGKTRALTYRILTMKVRPSGPWDGKWRFVLYDIPEHRRDARDALRDHLKRLGLQKFQQSAGITPHECRNEIEFIVELLDVRKYVRLVVAEHLDDEARWKRVFKLDRLS